MANYKTPTNGFKKGVSGNPSGRPKVPDEVRDLARQYTLEAIETIGGLMRTAENENVRLSAADKILERGWGKASQPITGEDGKQLVIVVQTGEDKKALEEV